MRPARYLTSIDLQPLTVRVGDDKDEIPGFSLRLHWLSLADQKSYVGDPLFIDTESLKSLLDELRHDVRKASS
jgi:hypothetical protein